MATLPAVLGVGCALRTGLERARREGYDVAMIMAGNNKDNPAEIPACSTRFATEATTW